MKTEQEPSLPAGEKNKNKRQDPTLPVNLKSLPGESLQDSNDQITVQINLRIHPQIYEFFKEILEFLDVSFDEWVSSEILANIKGMEFEDTNFIIHFIADRFQKALKESGVRK